MTKPRHTYIYFIKPGGNKQGIMRTLLEPHLDPFLRYSHRGSGVDEVTEEVSALGGLVSGADLCTQEAVEA